VTYRSGKTFTHEVGLSAAFRQWRAESHCRFLHGYALSFTFTFQATDLDQHGWVVDFGGLKLLRRWLEDTFDHKTVIASDDPELGWFEHADRVGLLDLVILDDGVGCERFAKHGADLATRFLYETDLNDRVRLVSCRVAEHGGNFAEWVVDP
jgi:6-pyruvoyltetrahydropterin/6-carboxytetrahydropterin synthase